MSDPIAAVATGGGASAIGIVRVSGDGCDEVCGKVFRVPGGRPFSSLPPRRMVLGEILDREGRTIDRGLAVRFPGPGSYTGEDQAELHCHGSPVVLRETLSALFAAGARQAEAGEFTKRAFLGGRMDLTQAEAVMDLIEAESAAAARNAAAQLDGALRRTLDPVREGLLDVASRFYAVVDYPDEDVEDAGPEEIAAVLETAEEDLGRLLSTFDRGRTLKGGVRTAIVGPPNAGKSSLFNALAGRDRAIVTEIPGTTRDTVEETAVCGGALLRIIDTAGIRETEDPVERLGVERARKAVEEADLILVVLDGTEDPGPEALDALGQVRRSGKPWIAVRSKRDLPSSHADDAADGAYGSVWISSVTGEGLPDLEAAIVSLYPPEEERTGSLLTDARQEDAVRRARDAVRRARGALAAGMPPDAPLTDVEEALGALGELTGHTAKEEIVSRIFERFCVGK